MYNHSEDTTLYLAGFEMFIIETWPPNYLRLFYNRKIKCVTAYDSDKMRIVSVLLKRFSIPNRDLTVWQDLFVFTEISIMQNDLWTQLSIKPQCLRFTVFIISVSWQMQSLFLPVVFISSPVLSDPQYCGIFPLLLGKIVNCICYVFPAVSDPEEKLDFMLDR